MSTRYGADHLPEHGDEVTVDAAPDDVYALVADVTRTGEMSPVCKACWWDEPASGPAVGAWFTGRNETPEQTWDVRCQVVTADPGRGFAFETHGRIEAPSEVGMVRWSYTFTPEGDGTRVTERWEPQPEWALRYRARPEVAESDDPDGAVHDRLIAARDTARHGIAQTLAALKRLAERT
jgi:hypothetical protein